MPVNLSDEYAPDLTLNDVIFEAYDLLQVATDGETIAGDLFNRALASLNLMLKLWETQGIHLWTMDEGSLFMRVGRPSFDFRNEGFEGIAANTNTVHLANTFVQRSTTLAVVMGGLAVTLDNVDDLSVGDQIGMINGSNDLEWYIVMEIVANVVTLSRPADSAIAANEVVYTYHYLNFSTLTIANAGTAVLDVADTTIFTIGDSVYVHLTDNSTEERIISDINQGANQITLSVAISGPAGIGEEVVNITTRRDKFKPIARILDDQVRRRESTDYEIPIVFQSRKDYFDLPNKNQNGTPIQAYYDRQQQQGIMYVWNPPGNATSIINFSYERRLMIMTDADETFDLPSTYLEAVVYNLAKRLIPKVGCSAARKQDIKDGATEYLDNALAFDQAVYPIRLKPQRYG